MRKGVGVGVKARVDEVRDVRPASTIALRQLHRIAVVGLVTRNPKLAETILGECLPLAASAVGVLLVAHHHRLTKDRREARLELLTDQGHSGCRIGLFGQHAVEHEQFGEGAWHLTQRERRVHRQCRLTLARKGKVHAVAELVRDGHQVAQRVGVIEHDEGLGVLCHGRAEGSPTLALARLGIDPLLVKDALGDTQDLRREAPESVLHDLTSLDVRHRTPFAKRRVLIGKMQLLEPHQFGLLRKPTLRHAIARLNCLHHRVDPRRLELI